ncbi:hypothetical protein CLV59_102555 [Chitinophaga dinghuensis]|uniref:Uncharacterized protein n=1 Tax=Chitinophaga dinghuensis TaxID=1539050 RepID=A0A327W5Q4_9BACT|nr:hypothetical protein [Chitinophaga dinghuensis]RAJ85849.1 hypothetical protein CLV59_102555 [Chitinophaga dinghuensis]
MKNNYISIAVPVPCSARWEEMQVTGDGRYCGSCAKTVIDFTGYSDVQLIEFFSKEKGSVCGHFRSTQLGRRLQPMTPQLRLMPVMLLTVGMLLSGVATTAQQLPPQTKNTTATVVHAKTSPPCKKVSHKKVKPAGTAKKRRGKIKTYTLGTGVEVGLLEDINVTGTAVVPPPPPPIPDSKPVQKEDSAMVKPHQ